MALGDGIRYNIAQVDPVERGLLREAFVELNKRFYPGSRTDMVPGGVSWWFKQDEIHHSTHVHQGPEFLPWHRVIVNRLEDLLRQINPQLSLHYWDWTQDPRAIANANLGNGNIGTLNLFTPDFMGYGGSTSDVIGEPWASAGYYEPGASPHRDAGDNPADPPQQVRRRIVDAVGPASTQNDDNILSKLDYGQMRTTLEPVHDAMHGFVAMGGQHISFRDPFVFLLHSNVDRLFAKWQTDPAHPERLDPVTVYGSESGQLNVNVEPWSTGHSIDSFNVEHLTRPWYAPENLGSPLPYKHPSVVAPPCYDTNGTGKPVVEVLNPGVPPVINFNSIPSGDTAMRAAVFRVFACHDVTIRVKQGSEPAAPFSVMQPPSGSKTVSHGPTSFVEVRIWLGYTAGSAGVPVPDETVTFECPENGGAWTFTLRANAIDRPTVAVMMALDQSWSMNDLAGTSGAKRIDVLKSAARVFVDVVQKDNAVGLIRFDHNSYDVADPTWPGLPITTMTSDGPDVARQLAVDKVDAHVPNPSGSTSVGDGVDRARQVLNGLPAGAFQQRALIVLTDGLENDPLWISDVLASGAIDARTFAIGLGSEQQVNTQALRDLAHQTQGFLYLTGLLTPSTDDYFRLSKFFLQILAGVTNTDVIVDPSGYIAPGTTVRVPFWVTEADVDCTPLLLTDVNVVTLAVETPEGTLIDAAAASGLGITASTGVQSRHYRFTLPVAIGSGQQEGLWHAVLEVDKRAYRKALADKERHDRRQQEQLRAHGARYSVVVQTHSNLRMTAEVEQQSLEPGAQLIFRAALTEYEVPVEHRAKVVVELTRPGGALVPVELDEVLPGTFEGGISATAPGTYQARFLARGVSLRGTPFTREAMGSAAVWRGGDRPYEPPRKPKDDEWPRRLAELLRDRSVSDELRRHLSEAGVDTHDPEARPSS